jgi:hypothetical protein
MERVDGVVLYRGRICVHIPEKAVAPQRCGLSKLVAVGLQCFDDDFAHPLHAAVIFPVYFIQALAQPEVVSLIGCSGESMVDEDACPRSREGS